MFSKSLSLGKWFGIEIRLDFSWFIIFFLVTWSLAFGILPDTYPSLGLKLNIILGLITSVLFFLSALIHELTHSLVARSAGLEVKRITLFLFGGAALIDEEPSSPKAEFKIAVVGPGASFLIALIFWSLKVWSRQLGFSLPLIAVFSTLASINIMMALFNLLPGFPLDGGRVLRAILWKLSRDYKKATRWAASGGRVVAWLLIFTGASRLLTADLGGGIWLMFLGLFLDQAASASEKESLLRAALSNVLVKSVMLPNPPIVPSQTPASDLINRYFLPSRRHCLPVSDGGGKPLGLISIDNLKNIKPADQERTTVADLMIPIGEITPLRPEQSVITGIHYLANAKTPALPVILNNKIVGLLAKEDLGIYLTLINLARANRET